MPLTAGPGDSLYEFGPFLADPVVGRLYHRDEEVPLTPKAFKVLMVLVESSGRLVDKDALFSQVWPDTFVEPNNLARNISMIRRALHDHDAEQEYIATLSGRGYRFVSRVSRVSRSDFSALPRPASAQGSIAAAASPAGSPGSLETRLAEPQPRPLGGVAGFTGRLRAYRQGLAVTMVVAGLLSVAGALTFGRDTPGEHGSPLRLWQLTTTGRLDGEPTWSPDGQAIAYSSERDGRHNIWTQRVSGGSPVQITSGAARDWQPSWSPDGRYIAFRSERDGGGLFVAPAAGGGARKLAVFGYQPAWSPEGSKILFCAGRDLYLVGLDGQPPSQLAAQVPPSVTGRCRVAWHPDGQRVSLYGRHGNDVPALLTVSVTNGAKVYSRISAQVEQRLREAEVRLGGFTWAPSGDALYFEGRSERTQNLWRIRVNPRSLEWIAGPDRLTTGSGLDSSLALSPDGRRLAFGSRFERTSVWSLPFDAIDGRITGEGEPITPDGADAKILDISPDGRQLVYRVTARDTDELWIRSLDRRGERLRKMEIDAAIVHPRWSPDGTQLAYLRRPTARTQPASVVLLGVDTDTERHVRPVSQPEIVYDWSLDGRSLLVRCRADAGRPAICRLPASGRRPEMQVLAAHPDRSLYAAAYSPDGRWVSFIAARDLSRSAVFVTPSAGGRWTAVTSSDDHWFRDLPRWSPDGRTLYFLSNHTGFWNIWGRRFDPDAGLPQGEPFQVSRFDSSVQMVHPEVSSLQFAVTRDRLILPVTQASGAVWILEHGDQ